MLVGLLWSAECDLSRAKKDSSWLNQRASGWRSDQSEKRGRPDQFWSKADHIHGLRSV